MPLETVIQPNRHTKLLVWHITEPAEALLQGVILRPESERRIDGMMSELHQRGFLAVRQLLLSEGYNDSDVSYDESGKPLLSDGKHISISHSHQRAAIGISDKPIGIDLEMQRDKILRIADRFHENSQLSQNEKAVFIRELTVVWGIKESIFKIRNEKGISFIDHIFVDKFDIADAKVKARLHFDDAITSYSCHYFEIDGYTLVYVSDHDAI